jgi:hypothetical protein
MKQALRWVGSTLRLAHHLELHGLWRGKQCWRVAESGKGVHSERYRLRISFVYRALTIPQSLLCRAKLRAALVSLAYSRTSITHSDMPPSAPLSVAGFPPPSAFHLSDRSINSVRYEAFLAVLMNLCLSRSRAEGRCHEQRPPCCTYSSWVSLQA